jgi:inorganic pyrophosphatase
LPDSGPYFTLLPSDALVLCQKAVALLTIMAARAIGRMTMIDAGMKDRNVIAVATGDPQFNGYQQAVELPTHKPLMMRRFPQDYKLLEDKRVQAGIT